MDRINIEYVVWVVWAAKSSRIWFTNLTLCKAAILMSFQVVTLWEPYQSFGSTSQKNIQEHIQNFMLSIGDWNSVSPRSPGSHAVNQVQPVFKQGYPPLTPVCKSVPRLSCSSNSRSNLTDHENHLRNFCKKTDVQASSLKGSAILEPRNLCIFAFLQVDTGVGQKLASHSLSLGCF